MPETKKPERMGEVSFNSSKEKMKIIAYKNANDMTVQFEDGTIKEHAAYADFKKGWIKKPKSRTVTGKVPPKETELKLTPEQIVFEDILKYAESYRVSVKDLAKEATVAPIVCIMLCKKAVLCYLQFAVKSTVGDIRYLGSLARKSGIEVDPRDLAWLHDFDFEVTEDWRKPTKADSVVAMEIMDTIYEKVGSK